LEINFHISDFFIIIFYFGAILFIGIKSGKNSVTKIDYLIASRKITLPAFVATLVSSFYGGILGVGEFTYRYGISSWFLNALPYYIFITFFAFFLASKIRKTRLVTIPEKLKSSYGKNVSIAGAVLIILLVTPAPYLYMLGIIIQLFTGWDLWMAMLLILLVSSFALFRGGFKSNVNINILEFFMMFAGFAIIIPFCIINIGSPGFIFNNLPDSHINLTGNHSIQYLIVWFIIGSWALVDPTFHQRCYAAKSEKTAKKGVLISLIFWFIFDSMTTLAGLYAFVYISDIENPVLSYPVLANAILPPIAKGFFFIGLIATIMSTFNSNLFISAATFGNDILPDFKKVDGKKNSLSKIGIIITGIISILLPILIPSVVQIWYTVGSLTIPALLISVISSYSEKFKVKNSFIFSAMLLSFSISLFSLIYGSIRVLNGIPQYVAGIEPIYPGMLAGFFVYLSGLIYKFFKK